MAAAQNLTPAYPVGYTIFGVAAMPAHQQRALDWETPAVMLVLTTPGGKYGDGGRLFPARDPEGNGAGTLFGWDDESEFFVHTDATAVDTDNPYAGRTIVEVRAFTDAELEERYWDRYDADAAAVLVLDDGTCLYPSRDPEGNGGGCWFTTDSKGKQFGYLFAE